MCIDTAVTSHWVWKRSLTSFLSVLVVDQQRRAQVGHRDPRGHLQHADAAGGAGG